MELIGDYKYFGIEPLPNDGKRKTPIYSIFNKRQGIELGQIKWYGAWRQYCFFPDMGVDTVWSHDCLDDICGFMERLKYAREQKAERSGDE